MIALSVCPSDWVDLWKVVVGVDEDLGLALLDQERNVEHVLDRLPEVVRVYDEPSELKRNYLIFNGNWAKQKHSV